MIPIIPEDISIPDPILGITSIITLFCGCVFLLRACSCIKNSRFVALGLYALFSLVCLSTSAISGLATLNIHSYQRLIYDVKVADIHFSRVAAQMYKAEIRLAGKEQSQTYKIWGDEWELSARVIKWKAPLTKLGFNSLYRLDRLQGRYGSIRQERDAPRSVFSLHQESHLDIWTLVDRHKLWLPGLDAFYGSATYLPMVDDASYQIHMTQLGLYAKPLNEVALEAVSKWK
jgi:hypothetical protein